MENEFVDYSTALALKELGFDGGYLGLYVKNQVELLVGNNFGEIGFYDIKAPLYQQAFRWFREKYNLDSFVMPLEDRHNPGIIGYQFKIHVPSVHQGLWNTYEEAELACLRKLIEIVNQNKDE